MGTKKPRFGTIDWLLLYGKQVNASCQHCGHAVPVRRKTVEAMAIKYAKLEDAAPHFRCSRCGERKCVLTTGIFL